MKSLKLVRVLIAENDFGKVFAEKCLFLGNSSRKPEMPCGSSGSSSGALSGCAQRAGFSYPARARRAWEPPENTDAVSREWKLQFCKP